MQRSGSLSNAFASHLNHTLMKEFKSRKMWTNHHVTASKSSSKSSSSASSFAWSHDFGLRNGRVLVSRLWRLGIQSYWPLPRLEMASFWPLPRLFEGAPSPPGRECRPKARNDGQRRQRRRHLASMSRNTSFARKKRRCSPSGGLEPCLLSRLEGYELHS